MEKLVAIQGACISCPMSRIPSPGFGFENRLVGTSDPETCATDQTILTENDSTVGFNIFPFPGCALTPTGRCTPLPKIVAYSYSSPWKNTAEPFADIEEKILTEGSFFECIFGSTKVTITKAGQDGLTVGLLDICDAVMEAYNALSDPPTIEELRDFIEAFNAFIEAPNGIIDMSQLGHVEVSNENIIDALISPDAYNTDALESLAALIGLENLTGLVADAQKVLSTGSDPDGSDFTYAEYLEILYPLAKLEATALEQAIGEFDNYTDEFTSAEAIGNSLNALGVTGAAADELLTKLGPKVGTSLVALGIISAGVGVHGIISEMANGTLDFNANDTLEVTSTGAGILATGAGALALIAGTGGTAALVLGLVALATGIASIFTDDKVYFDDRADVVDDALNPENSDFRSSPPERYDYDTQPQYVTLTGSSDDVDHTGPQGAPLPGQFNCAMTVCD